MERIKIRYQAAQDALSRLKEDLDILKNKQDTFYLKYHRQFRNSAIQSFEFSIDTLWKFIKEFLDYKYNVTILAPTPRAIFRELLIGLITKAEFEKISKIVADRNLTSHTYNESLAEEIVIHLPEYYDLMQKIA